MAQEHEQQLARTVSQCHRDTETLTARAESQAKALESMHARQVASLEQARIRESDALQMQMQSIQQRASSAEVTMQTEHADALRLLSGRHEESMAAATQEHSAATSRLAEELREAALATERQQADTAEAHATQMQTLETAAAATQSSLRHELAEAQSEHCLLYTSPSPRDGLLSRMPSSA